MSISSSIDSLKTKTSDPYTVKASVDGNGGMETSEVTGDRTTGAFAKATEKNMGRDQFLQLLTAQLQHQDPLAPQDNGEFVAQLAQFSQLESMSNVSASMETLKKSFETSLGIQSNSAQSVTNSTSVSLIGKDVRLRQKTFDWLGSGKADFRVHLGEKKDATVQILNSKDEVIKEIKVNGKDATNAAKITWDGTNANGQKVDADTYKLKVVGEEKDTALYCFVEDTVEGVRYTANGPVVKVAGKELPVGNILEVNTETRTAESDIIDMTMGQALSLVGKNVKYKDSGTSFAVNEDVTKQGDPKTFNLDFGGADSAVVVLKNSKGEVVRKYSVENKGTGVEQIQIPTNAVNGVGGKYSVSIEGNDGAFFYNQNKIDGVIPTAGGIKLKVAGMQLNAKDILEVSS